MDHLSFSQISKYMQCPRSFKFYYKERLRERTATAFLAFGSAMDTALNSILLDLKKNGSVSVDYKKNFDDTWEKIEINKVSYDLRSCTKVGYAKADFVADILTDDDLLQLQLDLFNYLGDIPQDVSIATMPKDYAALRELTKDVFKQLDEKKSLRAQVPFSEDDHKALNLLNWHSMRRKGHLMLDAYVQDIVPKIDEVLEVQKKVELMSPCGSKLIGFVDAVVKFKGNNFYTVLDNKTSASPYDDNKIKFSQQLAMYCYQLNLSHAAYAVMLKNISLNKDKVCSECGHNGSGQRHKTCANEVNSKRCGGAWIEKVKPEAQTQLLQGPVSEYTQNLVMETAADVLDAIKSGVFPRNLNTCQSIYGQPCGYLALCWRNNKDGLEVVP